MTDPFMYGYKEVRDLTLKIIEKLNKNKIICTILTKGIYPKELLNTKKYRTENEYGITLVSLNKRFKDKYEPFSAPYIQRINALKKLHDAGLKTWVSMEPYPTPNFIKQDLLKILNKISFVDNIIFGKLNYNIESNDFTFKDNGFFYEECAEIVEKFCEEKNKKYHIKYGTKKVNNRITVKIFKENTYQKELLTI